MKKLIAALVMSSALIAPGAAFGAQITLTTQLNNYYGNGAYLALYLTDPNGNYAGTMWLSGGRSRYYRHLIDWMRLSGGDMLGISGVTGASTGSGRTLKVTLDIADSLIDAGYNIHIDATAQNFRESPSEIVVPLTSAGAGQIQQGRRFIKAFKYDL